MKPGCEAPRGAPEARQEPKSRRRLARTRKASCWSYQSPKRAGQALGQARQNQIYPWVSCSVGPGRAEGQSLGQGGCRDVNLQAFGAAGSTHAYGRAAFMARAQLPGSSRCRERHRDRDTIQRGWNIHPDTPNPAKERPGFALETHWGRCISRGHRCPLAPSPLQSGSLLPTRLLAWRGAVWAGAGEQTQACSLQLPCKQRTGGGAARASQTEKHQISCGQGGAGKVPRVQTQSLSPLWSQRSPATRLLTQPQQLGCSGGR